MFRNNENKKWFGMIVAIVVCLAMVGTTFGGQTIYVDADATGANDGSSWGDAYNYLQDALATALSGDEIWVAEGTYKPDANSANPGGSSDREAMFSLINGVGIYGGFAGGETSRDQRDAATNVTILSGDLDGNDVQVDPCDLPDEPTRAENSYHVVTGSGTNETALLDGFTISGGNANGSPGSFDTTGGGMYSWIGSPTITNCSFSGNSANIYGGGMCINYNSRPTITNCTFSGNSAGYGGGMYNSGSSPTLTSCTFSGNSAGYGGGMNNSDSSPTLTNCTFSGNSADYGGGMYNRQNSNPTLSNCTFRENSAKDDGGGMYNNNSSPTVTNCTFGENSASEWGGGMYNVDSNPTLTNCTFSENVGFGGGILNDSSSPKVTNCTFSGNSSRGGGGVYNMYNSNPEMTNCLFIGNFANGGGGMENFASSPTLTNCTFSGNSSNSGGGIWSRADSNITLRNCSFTGNSAVREGGGLGNVDMSLMTVTNCILWGNTAGYRGPQVTVKNNSTLSISYCDVQGGRGAIYNDSSTVNWGSGNIDADPIFVDADGPDNIIGTEDDDLRLWAGSPCIDAGDNDAVPLDANDIDGDGNTVEPIPWDLDGSPRFVDDPNTADTGNGTPPVVDMGACEFIDLNYIEITGVTQVSESSGAQYTCTAHYSGGSTSIVTDTWSEDSIYASIDSSGYLTTTSVTSDQPCTITATYGGKSDTHDVIIKDSSDISLQKCKVKAGKTMGQDSISVSGRIDVTADEFTSADKIYVDIWSDADDYCVYSESIDRHLFSGKKGRYSHRYRVKKGQPGAITTFKLDTKKGKFTLAAKKVDLTGLGCPLSVEIEIGDYYGVGQADEDIVNGPRKSIPIQLMRGYADTLGVDSLRVRLNNRKASSDSLSVKGTIIVDDNSKPTDGVVVSWGSQSFTIPGSSFTSRGARYQCRNVNVSGGSVSITIDLDKCSFMVGINKADIDSDSGDFGIAFGNFDKTVAEADLP